jgi:hypothetical protein
MKQIWLAEIFEIDQSEITLSKSWTKTDFEWTLTVDLTIQRQIPYIYLIVPTKEDARISYQTLPVNPSSHYRENRTFRLKIS